jgi:hypothetical protein
MKVTNCFYVRILPTTKVDRVISMCTNLGLVLEHMDVPHAVLRLKNVASRKTTEEKLDKCGLFQRVSFMKNFNLE